MTAPIEDVSTLPGKKLSDQMAKVIGKVTNIYATDDGYPMWVGVDASPGMGGKRTVIVPLARLKDEDGELRVPYSKQRIIESPEVDADAGISAECDRLLRDFYGIDVGDQEMRSDNKSYAALVPENGAPRSASKIPTRSTRRTPISGPRRARSGCTIRAAPRRAMSRPATWPTTTSRSTTPSRTGEPGYAVMG